MRRRRCASAAATMSLPRKQQERYLLHRRKRLAAAGRAFRKGVLPICFPSALPPSFLPYLLLLFQNSKMLAGPARVTMATEAKVELGRRRERSRDRASPRPDWSENKEGGRGGWLDAGQAMMSHAHRLPDGKDPHPGAPAGSKHRHNRHVFKVGLSRAAGFYTSSVIPGSPTHYL